MTFADTNPAAAAAALDRMIADQGAWRVLAGLVRRLARGVMPTAQAGVEVPDYLRQDLGLPELPPLRPLFPPRGFLPLPRERSFVPEDLDWDLGRTDILPQGTAASARLQA